MRTYIWTIPTRVFHWLLAIGFATTYILGEFDDLGNLHFAFGAFVGTLIFFRLIFGLVGPRYSNFKDFQIGFNNQRTFISTYFLKEEKYAGHNPAASVIMLSILLVGIFCSISGYLLYANENTAFNVGINEDFLEESHGVLAITFLVLVIIHLSGILADTIFHSKTGTILSIFTGYKNIEAENTRLNVFHKTFALLWLIIPFFLFYFAYGLPVNKENNKTEIENHESYEEDDD